MKIFQIIIICVVVSKCRNAKNGDSEKQYEFGFTIDGQQHRYEKKDVNGIIQGEFGFITADGIYHVTTYATDENGGFRILSMRNVRISDPLDGSGGTFSNKVSAAEVQSAGNIKKPQNKPPSYTSLTNTQPPSTSVFIPPSKMDYVIQTTTKRAPLVFTTQSTIKPACAGCGYVTYASTSKGPIVQTVTSPSAFDRPSGQIFQTTTTSPFSSVGVTATSGAFGQNNGYTPSVFAPINNQQQPQFPPASTPQTAPLPISHENLVIQVNNDSTSAFQNSPQQTGSSQFISPVGPPSSLSQTPSQFIEPPSISPQQPVPQLPNPQQLIPQQSLPQQPISQQTIPQKPPSQYPSVPPDNNHQIQQNVDVFNPMYEGTPSLPVQNDTIQLPVNTFARPPISNEPDFDKKIPPEASKKPSHSKVIVENGTIYVPNNPPIKIQDKYPGMVDGLPKGIEEKDIVDLLYKFNYTIGFHGHYEKGLKNGTKIGGYFVNGRDGYSRVVTYIADELGYRPKFKLIKLGLDSPDTPKEDTEKSFGLKNFEFVWYPLV